MSIKRRKTKQSADFSSKSNWISSYRPRSSSQSLFIRRSVRGNRRKKRTREKSVGNEHQWRRIAAQMERRKKGRKRPTERETDRDTESDTLGKERRKDEERELMNERSFDCRWNEHNADAFVRIRRAACWTELNMDERTNELTNEQRSCLCVVWF